MKKKFLALALLPLLLSGCSEKFEGKTVPIDVSSQSGVIGHFDLLSPADKSIVHNFATFTWERAENAKYYQIEISSTKTFYVDAKALYVKESNLSQPRFDLTYQLPKKDITYYWRVTAINDEYEMLSTSVWEFKYEASKLSEIPIDIEDEQDWAVHKDGSKANVSVDRQNFFHNGGKNSLKIEFKMEDTGVHDDDDEEKKKTRGWIVVTKSEDRELYGTDSFYLNFYYSGHESDILIRVLDGDGEYWHNHVRISQNCRQTILMRYSDFELRTSGTNIFNREFDWQHISYFEVVFEKTFGDGVCMISDVKAVNYEDYSHLFMNQMNFKRPDMDEWTYEEYDFDKTVSADGSEITIGYSGSEPHKFDKGWGYQNVNVNQFLGDGDALKMQVKYTGTSTSAVFYFRVLEEDGDRWQFKTPFTYFVKDEYKELIIPLKSFRRPDNAEMSGDGGKQFYFIKKFNFGLADNYATGTISIKNLEMVNTVPDVVDNKTIIAPSTGLIEDFNSYGIYTEIYYHWNQGTVNKDEAMKLDEYQSIGGYTNPYCAEFDYKADMEPATYNVDVDTSAVSGKNAFQIYLKDSTPRDPAASSHLKDDEIAAKMGIQISLKSGEQYQYIIECVKKDWNVYTIPFSCFELTKHGYDIDQPITSNKITNIGFGFQYFYMNKQGKKDPKYTIANPVYLDEIYLVETEATEVSIIESDLSIKADPLNPDLIMVDNMEKYTSNEEVFGYWKYASYLDYNLMEKSTEVSSRGGTASLLMQYKGATSVSYERGTVFHTSVKAYGIGIDIKSDGKATVFINLNHRSGTKLIKYRYELTPTFYGGSTGWIHYEIGLDNFKDVTTGSTNKLAQNDVKAIRSVSFGIVNSDSSQSEIYVDNVCFLRNIDYTTLKKSSIS